MQVTITAVTATAIVTTACTGLVGVIVWNVKQVIALKVSHAELVQVVRALACMKSKSAEILECQKQSEGL